MAVKYAAEENERQRMICEKEDQGRKLQQKLQKIMKDEELQMNKIINKQIQDDIAYELFAFSDWDTGGITEDEILKKCDELFDDAPIKFQAREDSRVDLALKKMIEELRITIPIVWIKGKLYLIGINRINLEFKGEHLIAQIGGGAQKFEMYITKNHRMLERQLIIKMI